MVIVFYQVGAENETSMTRNCVRLNIHFTRTTVGSACVLFLNATCSCGNKKKPWVPAQNISVLGEKINVNNDELQRKPTNKAGLMR